MPTPSDDTRSTARAIGQLCVGGDWACAHGDLSGLRHVAQCLAVKSQEPMHCELNELVEACANDPERAVELWIQLREQLFRASDA